MHRGLAHHRQRHLLADHGTRVEVVGAGTLAQRVEVHLALGVARKAPASAGIEQRYEARLPTAGQR